MDEPQQTLSIPSLVAFAIVSFFAIRYFFFSPSSGSASSSSSSSQSSFGGRSTARRRNFPPERVDTVANMFPQLNRRDIEFDLMQNGGSVQATSEKVLTSGRLPAAPPNFIPVYAAPPAPPASTTSSQSRSQQKQVHQDLITRYNLSAKVAETTPADMTATAAEDDAIQSKEKQKQKGGWSTNKNERQELMKRRREEMILAARRKMEEKERKGKAPAI